MLVWKLKYLRFCSVKVYINTTNVLPAEKKFEIGEIYVT